MGTSDTVPSAPDIPEPPPGSIVLDHADYAWQRRANSSDWYRTRGTHAWAWTELTNLRGPLTVVYTPPATHPACTGCGRTLHRVHGMWLDDAGRGHCVGGARQGRNGHTAPDPDAGRFVLHATNIMTGTRGDQTFLSLAGPDGSADVLLHPNDLALLHAGLGERLGAAEPPPAAVYLIEDRDTSGVGPWHRDGLIAYPNAKAAQAAVERDYGAVEWDEDLFARLPGTSTAWWRIVELPLAVTAPTGGAS